MPLDNNLIPNIASLYQRGVLVPFIGSGMSRPTCTSWFQLLAKLSDLAGMSEDAQRLRKAESSKKTKPLETSELYRIADAVVHKMHGLSPSEKAIRYRKGLQSWKDGETASIPKNMSAVADGLFWPLILTTNYDDLYWAASKNKNNVLQIAGRGIEDCHAVLRSLDHISPPIYWALQGFLGGQIHDPGEIFPFEKSMQRQQLESQVVIGHQQYQQAINGDTHFRRAFAEVFRRRSFIFVGSGILEDYLLNLFSEIIYNHGPSAFPHFALLPQREQDSGKFDERFLQRRLGIKPLFWDTSDEIGDFFNTLKRDATPKINIINDSNVIFLQSKSFTLGNNLQVTLTFRTVTNDPEIGSAVAVSAGRTTDNHPIMGDFGDKYLISTKRSKDISQWKAITPVNNAFVFQYESDPLFAFAARGPKSDNSDYRDLAVIPEAVCAGLVEIERQNFTTVYMGSIASGHSAKNLWHPIHPFAQTLRGIHKFIEKTIGKLKNIEVCIVDPRIWSLILSDKLPVQEILKAKSFPVSVELRRSDGHVDVYNLLIEDGATVQNVLEKCALDVTQWRVELRPRPTDGSGSPEPLDQIVTATMTLLVLPIVAPPPSAPAGIASAPP